MFYKRGFCPVPNKMRSSIAVWPEYLGRMSRIAK
uniref:Uncharacterized protein n=1 Tax=Anguilla anguilla TaxID=7936 RepID=A0A0E9QB03_ANGAN